MAAPNTTAADQSAAVIDAYKKVIELNNRNYSSFDEIFTQAVIPNDFTSIGKSYKFEIYTDLPLATTPLNEITDPAGTVIPNNQVVTLVPKEHGDWTVISYLANATIFDQYFSQSVAERFAYQMFKTHEALKETALLAANNKFVSSGSSILTPGTADTATGAITTADVIAVQTFLKTNNAPKFGNHYIAYIAPAVAAQLRSEASSKQGWRDVSTYNGGVEIYNGEIGIYEGIRFIEHGSITPITNSGGDTVYPTIFAGVNAAAAAEPKKGEIVLDGTINDPLNRKQPVGWHSFVDYGVYFQSNIAVLYSRTAEGA